MSASQTQTVKGLPQPHTCPWIVQYFLISPLRKLMEPPKKLLGPYVEPGMTVLDVGCGFGFFTLPLARMVGSKGRVLAVDIEPRAVKRLQKRARKAGLSDRIQASACGPRDLGLSKFEGQVDLITVIHTLHEFEDLRSFLSQAAGLLTPGGRMLVIEPRGHLKPEQFAAEIEFCRRAGFGELDPPVLGRKQMAALFSPIPGPTGTSLSALR